MKAYLIVITFALLVSFAPAFAQENQTVCTQDVKQCPDGSYVGRDPKNGCNFYPCPTDSCAGITCEPSKLTCPDGFVASCSNTCSEGQCSTCTPSCAGHETTQACPTPPPAPMCGSGFGLKTKTDDKGCITGYECVPVSTTTCGNGVCDSGENYDICPNDCQLVCPAVYTPVCGTDGNTYSNECYAKAAHVSVAYTGQCGARQCGNYKCEEGENNDNCPSDCIRTGGCPLSIRCPDGSTALCEQTDSGCSCEQCPLPSLPPGCTQEKDDAGFLRVVCQHTCTPPPREAYEKCANAGGTPLTKTDANSCPYLDCQLGKETQIVKNPLVGALSCPREEEISEGIKKCEAHGLRGVVSFEGGCKISRCVEEESRCKLIPEEERKSIVESCGAAGKRVFVDFDNSGCPVPSCGTPDTCRKDAPSELFHACGERGGQVVIRRDENACIVFADCVHRGDTRDASVEETGRFPETTELLGLVFKLEELRIEFDRLARDANNIADYYKSTGAPDEGRYRRAASMLESARDKVDEIRAKLKDMLERISREDMLELRHDVRYIKEVMLKDILYVMLSENEEIEDIEEGEADDCGDDGTCFDRAIRVCRPVRFQPEGDFGPTMEIVGLEDERCVMKARMPERLGPPPGAIPGVNPPYEMTCKIPDYALGIRGPQDIIPHCEGSMVELMKRFGGPASTAGHEFPPPEGGPGGCKTIEACTDYCIDNYEDCAAWTKEHPAYGSPPSLEDLKRFKESGYRGAEVTSREVIYQSGPGGCLGPEECEDYCREHYEECKEFFEGRGFATTARTQTAGISTRPASNIGGESCRGCFDNGVCDVGECSYCLDCSK